MSRKRAKKRAEKTRAQNMKVWNMKGTEHAVWFCVQSTACSLVCQGYITSALLFYIDNTLWRGLSALTFGGVDHLSVYCSGDDGLGEILQVPAQTVAQDGELQLIQVCWGRI